MRFPYILIQESSPHIFGGINLSRLIKDMGRIAPEDTIIINPQDAVKIGIKNRDSVLVKSRNKAKVYPVMLRKIIQPGFLYLSTSSKTFDFETDPCSVRLRSTHKKPETRNQ